MGISIGHPEARRRGHWHRFGPCGHAVAQRLLPRHRVHGRAGARAAAPGGHPWDGTPAEETWLRCQGWWPVRWTCLHVNVFMLMLIGAEWSELAMCMMLVWCNDDVIMILIWCCYDVNWCWMIWIGHVSMFDDLYYLIFVHSSKDL